jgi:hypothetical protein
MEILDGLDGGVMVTLQTAETGLAGEKKMPVIGDGSRAFGRIHL